MKLSKVEISFDSKKLEDIDQTIDNELKPKLKIFKKGERVAVACGSRGINNLNLIVKRVIDNLKAIGTNPFMIPAMGSHGGATAQGQIEVLKSLGITEEYIGVPIVSNMDTVKIKQKKLPLDIFIAKDSYEADKTILINRIKPHTDFHGKFESGLLKMSVLGLGKHDGALSVHQYGVKGLKEYMPKVAKFLIEKKYIDMGIAIVENAYDETLLIKALEANDIVSEEAKLLKIAKKNMPSLPVDEIDLLIIERQGKNISGTGVDPNIIGRMKIPETLEPKWPSIKRIVVTDLTKESHGNAVGMGFADIITKKLFEKIDLRAVFENVSTATFLERGKIPLVADTSRQACETALRSLGLGKIDYKKIRIIYILDTLHLSEIYVSSAIFKEIKSKVRLILKDVEIFDQQGELNGFKN